MNLMTDTTATYIDLKKLSEGTVRRFYDALEQRGSVTESLPGGDKGFEGDGIALMVGAEVNGLYAYKGFASLEPDTTLYFPYGGVLLKHRYTIRHQALIESLLLQLKSDRKVCIVIKLDQQPIGAADNNAGDEVFWLARGFSHLDMQVFYRGDVKADSSQETFDFSVAPYKGGDPSINTELCVLYREAYKKRMGIPDITSESIERQLAFPNCSYLILWHNNALIGQVTLHIVDKECYVDSIHIKRKYWGTDAADILAQSLLNYAKNHSCDIVSGAAASNNWGSRRLMERFGLVAHYQMKRMFLNL